MATVQQQAEKLLRMQEDVKKLTAQMNVLKAQIRPYVQQGPIQTPSGTVSLVNGSVSEFVKKDKLKKVLMDTFKLSEDAANKIISMGAAKKIINSYVKATNV